ncbi:quinone-dependent dihydroorotate dehydrogenase [Pseudactinotalea sp. Z1739]|uniref:quinone-dependent dihydroorotate dehydrogenase n=1 Tax=Pseudactinotalea sp. Z1739 TaxID=3413028 RepID=UPI003C7D5BDD
MTTRPPDPQSGRALEPPERTVPRPGPPGPAAAAYRAVFARVLARSDPERAHHLAATAIGLAGRLGPVRTAVSLLSGASANRRALRAAAADGLRRRAPTAGGCVPQPAPTLFGRATGGLLGLAAGFDKNATMVAGLAALGFGFVEIGTVTARPQPGNERPRLWRVPERAALVNRMGFNNDGAAVVAERLHRLRRTAAGRRVVLGVNIGKSKLAPAAEAVADYACSARMLARYADYLVVNVSSPNTPGLRDLQQISSLRPILTAVQQAADAGAARPVPVLVKIAPDLADDDVDAVADLAAELGLDGVVAVNTTIDHDHGPGGMSGLPVRARGLEVVARLRRRCAPGQVIIGVGGISSPADARAYLAAGADAVQAYTAFIYAGPTWAAWMNRSLLQR